MKKNDGFPYDKEYGFDLEGKDITVLLVEDSETDAGIVLRLLSEKMPCRCHVLRARTLGEAEGFLSGCCEIDVAWIWGCLILQVLMKVMSAWRSLKILFRLSF